MTCVHPVLGWFFPPINLITFDKGGQEHHLYSVDGETESQRGNKSTGKPGVLFWHRGDLLTTSWSPFGVCTRCVCWLPPQARRGLGGPAAAPCGAVQSGRRFAGDVRLCHNPSALIGKSIAAVRSWGIKRRELSACSICAPSPYNLLDSCKM